MAKPRGRVIPIQPVAATAAAGSADAEMLVSLYEARRKIYPRAVHGWFARWRWTLVWITQLVFYGLPWLSWNGRQAVLFDLEARKFYLFELVLWPQDFIYLTGLLVISALSLFLFTAVAGRLWCGYACPQTVYTEIFLWIERRVEGDRAARMKLDQSAWGPRKLLRKGTKHALWIAIGLWTGFTFVGYFTPIETLGREVFGLALGPWESFWTLFYGFATYGNAGFLREQVCKYMCPYARFQSAMYDRDTLVVTYDALRGDPRGSRSRKADPRDLGLGDCISCGLCVEVCPTGIDIRDGLQYECIGCAACIDVCDGIMDKMGYARGLIGYSTERAMTERTGHAGIWRHVLRPRVAVYTAILAVLAGGLSASLWLRTPLKVDVIRDRGSLGRLVEDGRVENVFRLQIMNATEQPNRYRVTVGGLPGIAVASEPVIAVPAAQARLVPVRVQLPPQALKPGSHRIVFEVAPLDAGHRSVTEKSVFLVPR
jgi:cytochrome c oxidase accessory protein FixG